MAPARARSCVSSRPKKFASAGSVQVFGENPVENDDVLRRLVLVREDQGYPDYKVRQIIQAASWFYPNWSNDLAQSLLEDFELPGNRSIKKLSRGMRSAVGIVIGLAARAELTMLDEPYAGLDAVARQLFYDRLLSDYAEHPRTILLSTHLIDEIADLLEHVVMIDHGRIVLDASADDVRGHAATVSGSYVAVRSLPPAGTSCTTGPCSRGHRSSSPGNWTSMTAVGPLSCTSTWSRCHSRS